MAKPLSNFATENAHADLSVLEGGVAIITGSASGIGYSLAEESIKHGLNTVIADIEASAIDVAVAKLAHLAESNSVEVIGHRTDVSLEEDVQKLRDVVATHFADKPISLLACNAGVGAGGGVLTAREIDWNFVMGVNLFGVVHCLRTFVPSMLEQEAPGAVMATSSQDGLCAAQGVYGVSKHACVALMEALHGEVANRLSVHVLCPNVVATNIITSERNRPERLGGNPTAYQQNKDKIKNPVAERFLSMGMPPSRCATMSFDAIQSGVFYILAEAEEDPGYIYLEAETRMNAILNGTRPYRPRSEFISSVFNVGSRRK